MHELPNRNSTHKYAGVTQIQRQSSRERSCERARQSSWPLEVTAHLLRSLSVCMPVSVCFCLSRSLTRSLALSLLYSLLIAISHMHAHAYTCIHTHTHASGSRGFFRTQFARYGLQHRVYGLPAEWHGRRLQEVSRVCVGGGGLW